MQEKKAYSPPTVTDLGDVVENTQGISGDWYETWGQAWGPPVIDPPPFDEEDGEEGGGGAN